MNQGARQPRHGAKFPPVSLQGSGTLGHWPLGHSPLALSWEQQPEIWGSFLPRGQCKRRGLRTPEFSSFCHHLPAQPGLCHTRPRFPPPRLAQTGSQGPDLPPAWHAGLCEWRFMCLELLSGALARLRKHVTPDSDWGGLGKGGVASQTHAGERVPLCAGRWPRPVSGRGLEPRPARTCRGDSALGLLCGSNHGRARRAASRGPPDRAGHRRAGQGTFRASLGYQAARALPRWHSCY